jgi:alkylated DNA repair dioxygenase AlkB
VGDGTVAGPASRHPDGLVYQPDFITPDEERALLGAIERVEFSEVIFHGYKATRTVAHFGVDYEYDSGAVARDGSLPDWLVWLRDRGAALAGVEPERFVEALLTRYPAGATIGWHRDAPAFGSAVVGVSLGAPCRMRFRRTAGAATERFAVELEPRSAYVMSGAARWSWQHSIPGVPALRHSITFRTLRTAA